MVEPSSQSGNSGPHVGERDRINSMNESFWQPPPVPPQKASTDWANDVLRAVDTLDGVSATALRLIYQRSSTQAQVAARLGLSEIEVKTRVAHGMRQLTQLLVTRS